MTDLHPCEAATLAHALALYVVEHHGRDDVHDHDHPGDPLEAGAAVLLAGEIGIAAEFRVAIADVLVERRAHAGADFDAFARAVLSDVAEILLP